MYMCWHMFHVELEAYTVSENSRLCIVIIMQITQSMKCKVYDAKKVNQRAG